MDLNIRGFVMNGVYCCFAIIMLAELLKLPNECLATKNNRRLNDKHKIKKLKIDVKN